MKKILSAILAFSMIFAPFTNLLANEIVHATSMPRTISVATSTANRLMQEHNVPGVAISIIDAHTGFTWTRGFGYADTIAGIPVDPHTRFQIASTSKPFTAIAVMQLVEQGLVGLDNPVVTYIPEFSMWPSTRFGGNSDDITVRMLLNNTSGIVPDKFWGFLTYGRHYHQPVDNLIPWLATQEMIFVPGTRFNYANNNWTLLGILVARVMGYNNYVYGFAEHVENYIFEPIGMYRSTFLFDNHLQIAMPYGLNGTQDPMHVTNKIAAASMISTAYDISRFMHNILGSDPILPTDTITYMLQKHTDHVAMSSRQITGYGLGFIHTQTTDGFQVVGHGGNLIHYHTEMVFNPESGLGVFVATNSRNGFNLASHLAIYTLGTAVLEKTGQLTLDFIEPESNQLGLLYTAGILINTVAASANLQPWVGTYIFVPELPITVPMVTYATIYISDLGMPTISASNHMLETTGSPPSEVPLIYVNGRWFFYLTPLYFYMNPDNQATIYFWGGRFVRQR